MTEAPRRAWNAAGTPYVAAPRRATAWRVSEYTETGLFIETLGGVKLCRVGDGCVYFWDKKSRMEVAVSLDQLRELAE